MVGYLSLIKSHEDYRQCIFARHLVSGGPKYHFAPESRSMAVYERGLYYVMRLFYRFSSEHKKLEIGRISKHAIRK